MRVKRRVLGFVGAAAAALVAIWWLGGCATAGEPPGEAASGHHPDPGVLVGDLSEGDRETARARFAEGVERFRDGFVARAADRFRVALTHWDHPAIRFNLAMALVNLGQGPAALEQLWGAMRFGGAPLNLEHVEQIEEYSEALWESEVAHLVIRSEAPNVVVTVDGAPALDGPGYWEGLVRVGRDVRIDARQGAAEPITLVRALDAKTRTEVRYAAPSRGLAPPSVATRAATDADRRALQRRLVGFEVRWPTPDERAAWVSQADDLYMEASPPPLPSPELSKEVSRICRGASGDLAVVCKEAAAAQRTAAEVARDAQTCRREAKVARDAALRRLEELTRGGLVNELD